MTRSDLALQGSPIAIPTGGAFLTACARVVAATAELWFVYAWLFGLVAESMLIVLHFATAIAVACVAILFRRTVRAGLLVDAVLLLLTGPLAAIEMLTRGPLARRPALTLVADAPEQTTAADALHKAVLADRRPRRDPSGRRSIADRLASGDLEEQQFAIAALLRSYQPEMHPMLMSALQSPTPAIRVQAAAVFAKLRERISAQAKDLLASQPLDLSSRLETSTSCRTLARSPFLDCSVADALIAKAAELDEDAADAITDAAPVHAGQGSRPRSARAEAALNAPGRPFPSGSAAEGLAT
jgi:hypothetical protein